ncbi:MAG TPA: hypothetical protein VLJ59_01230 [Mycobacteriales bacterium]|nr:hypothetical protein [Mycobacteriales bacterium]
MNRRTGSSSSGFAVATEWLGRIAALLSVVLFVLVVLTIGKGLTMQKSAKQIVQDFHTTNGYFASRADLTDVAKVKNQLQVLTGVLAELNRSANVDVTYLAATIPDVQRLLAAGRGDVNIAYQLRGVASTLQQSAASIHNVAANARGTVAAVDTELARAITLVGQLNAQLAITERKLALLPSIGR